MKREALGRLAPDTRELLEFLNRALDVWRKEGHIP
jgi:hypothetical protein